MRRKLLVIALGLVVAITLGEIALRVFLIEDGMLLGEKPLPPYASTTNPKQRAWVDDWRARVASGDIEIGIGCYDTLLGSTHRKSATSIDGSYSTNSLGARGKREYAADPADGTLRLLCFGDSFTFCSEVGYEDTWQRHLEKLTTNCEAVNFGVGGHGTDQALLRYTRVRDAGEIRGQVVTAGIMLENIARNVNRYRPLYYPSTPVAYAKPRFVLENGRLTLVALPFADFGEYLDAIADGSVLDRLNAHERWTNEAPLGGALAMLRVWAAFEVSQAKRHRALWEREGEAFDVTVAILTEFHGRAMAAGAAAAPVLIFPARSDLEEPLQDGQAYWSPLTDALTSRGVDWIDMTPTLTGLCRSEGRSPGSLYVGGHLRSEANEAVAGAILAWLEAHSGLPVAPIRR